MAKLVRYDYRMIRTTNITNSKSPWNWSRTASFVLLAFLAIGAIELAGHQVGGAVVCFVLAVAYVPLRALRGRLSHAGTRR
jgi:hypothetical protein